MPQAMEALARYEIHRRLGAGGMGIVYLGSLVGPAGTRRVAIKRLLTAGDADAKPRERLVAEARLVFQLTHANICQVIDLGENEEGTFVVMEYVRGLDLRALLRQLEDRGQRLDVASAVYAAREVARALDYAHRRMNDDGSPLFLVHGDVTPQNVLLSVEGEVKLADFGIARALTMVAPGSQVVGGTRGFIAPELAVGNADHRADIYSLGMTLFAALVGPESDVRPGDVTAFRERRPDVTAELCSIVARATAPRPDERFLSAADLERALAVELARRYPEFTPSSLAAIVRDHAPAGAASSTETPEHGSLLSITVAETRPLNRDAPVVQPDTALPPQTVTALPSTRRNRVLWPVLLVGCIGALALGAHQFMTSSTSATPQVSSEPPSPPPSPPAAPPPQPTVTASATPASRQTPRQTAAPTPAPVRPRTSAPARRGEPHAVAPRATKGSGFLTVTSVPWGAVYVDNRKVGDETPLYRFRLSEGTHRVTVFYPDLGSYASPRTVVIKADETETIGFTR